MAVRDGPQEQCHLNDLAEVRERTIQMSCGGCWTQRSMCKGPEVEAYLPLLRKNHKGLWPE